MCAALFYYTCVYIYSLLNSCGYWTLNKYYYYYFVSKNCNQKIVATYFLRSKSVHHLRMQSYKLYHKARSPESPQQFPNWECFVCSRYHGPAHGCLLHYHILHIPVSPTISCLLALEFGSRSLLLLLRSSPMSRTAIATKSTLQSMMWNVLLQYQLLLDKKW